MRIVHRLVYERRMPESSNPHFTRAQLYQAGNVIFWIGKKETPKPNKTNLKIIVNLGRPENYETSWEMDWGLACEVIFFKWFF